MPEKRQLTSSYKVMVNGFIDESKQCSIWRHVNAASVDANAMNSIVFPCIKSSCFSARKKRGNQCQNLCQQLD